jgi:hypothetical protein
MKGHPKLRLYVKTHKERERDSKLYSTRPVIFAGDSKEIKIFCCLFENNDQNVKKLLHLFK